MTALPAGFENMGGRLLRRSASSPAAEQGDTITHPLKGAISGRSGRLGWRRERWTNKTTPDFPANLGARVASTSRSTLDEAIAATTIPTATNVLVPGVDGAKRGFSGGQGSLTPTTVGSSTATELSVTSAGAILLTTAADAFTTNGVDLEVIGFNDGAKLVLARQSAGNYTLAGQVNLFNFLDGKVGSSIDVLLTDAGA